MSLPKLVISSQFISAGRLAIKSQWRSSDISDSPKAKADIVHRLRKTNHFALFTSHFKLKPGFSLIELLVACHPKPWRRKAIQGFSLIELLVVISIIGLLTALATASLTNAQLKGRDARRKADLKTIQQALELYFQANGKYPYSTDPSSPCFPGLCDWSFIRPACPTIPWSWNACESDPNFDLRVALLPYINNIPVDPINEDVSGPTNLGYLYDGLPFSYTLYVRLENTKDPEINCPGGCGWSNYANYRVQNP